MRERFERGEASAAELKHAEDRAVDAAVALQEGAGIAVVTDGEMRRLSFQSGLPRRRRRLRRRPSRGLPVGRLARRRRRRPRHRAAAPAWACASGCGGGGTSPPRTSPTCGRGRTAIPKVTLASPSLYANLWSPEHSREAYPTLDEFLEDVAALTRDEIDELARLGCTYIQLDAPHYPLLIDPATRAFYEGQGWTADALARPRHRARQLGDGGPPRRSPSASTCAAATRPAAGSSRAATSRSRGRSSAA